MATLKGEKNMKVHIPPSPADPPLRKRFNHEEIRDANEVFIFPLQARQRPRATKDTIFNVSWSTSEWRAQQARYAPLDGAYWESVHSEVNNLNADRGAKPHGGHDGNGEDAGDDRIAIFAHIFFVFVIRFMGFCPSVSMLIFLPQ